MTRDLAESALLALALFALIVFAANVGYRADDSMPRCTEDAVLVGAGDFENGRWDRYACGPSVDDYTE